MKDFLNQFDLDNAFKALDELEYPTVKGGIRPNRVDLHEHFSRKQKTDLLIEDYYNVSSDADLEAAQEQREDEVAQAKLDRIEKIVDLDADSEEDLQAAYVGKFVIQCPQCMTLFYKKPEDVTTSEEDSSLANVGELCPNCSNDSGFTVVGKIEDATPEAAPVEEAPVEGEETGMEEVSVEGEEAPAEGGEEDLDLDLDLGDLDLGIEETGEQEPAEESLNLSKALKDASKKTELDTENHSENLTLNESNDKECEDGKCDGNCEGKECDESLNNSEAQKDASKNTELDTENHSENLTLNEDADLKKELGDYNEYIEYLQKEIEADEAALKTATNDFVKDSIQRRIDANKADLDAAMPQILKDAVDEQDAVDETADDTLADLDIEADVSTDAAALQNESSAEGEEEVEVKEALVEGCEGKECKEDVNILSGNSSSIDLGDAGAAIGATLPLLADDAGEEQAHAESNAKMDAEISKTAYDQKDRAKAHAMVNAKMDAEMLNEAAMTWDEKVDKADELLAELVVGINSLASPDDEDGYWFSDDAWRNRYLYYRGNFPKDVIDYLEKNIPLYNSKLPGIEFYYDSEDVPDDEYDEDDNSPAEVGYTLTEGVTTNEGCKGKDCDKVITEAESAEDVALDKLYDSKEFRTPVSQSVIDNFFNEAVDEVEIKDIEELDDKSLTETVTKYLKEVYDNVNSFSLTGCQFNEGTSQLLIKGDINFTSGKTKPTTFAFNPCGNRFFEGYNFDLCDTKAFRLYGKMKDKTFFTEGIRYSYHIQDNLVEGLIRN